VEKRLGLGEEEGEEGSGPRPRHHSAVVTRPGYDESDDSADGRPLPDAFRVSSSSNHSRDDVRALLPALRASVAHFHAAADALDATAAHLRHGPPAPPHGRDHRQVARALASVNERYRLLERRLTHPGGLDGRTLFKHVVFAPGLWTGYAGGVFPGLVERLDEEDWDGGVRWVGIIKACVDDAAAWMHDGAE
jgi:N-acetylated-alpha-linked acidic dipeptidase